MCRRTKNAYMTVETSLIVPMILGGIIFTIYLGLYLYNVCIIKQSAYIAALRGSRLTGVTSEAIETYAEQELGKLLNHKILANGNVRQEIRVSSHKVKVGITMDMNMLFFQWITSVSNFGTVESEAEADRINPVDIIRNVRKAYGSQISK